MSSKKRRRLYEGFEVLDIIQPETISSDVKTISVETVSNEVKTISPNVKTISRDAVISVDTVSDTVSKHKKMKPSLLELFVLREMAARLQNGISTFQSLEIARAAGTTLGGVRNALNRLKAKGLIVNAGFQKGARIGFTSYEMNNKCFEYLNELKGAKKTVSTETVSTETVSDTVSQYRKKEEEYLLTESLKRIGVKPDHLENYTGTVEELKDLIENFSYSVENNEIKVPQKLRLFLSLVRDKKPWVSQSLILQTEQDIQLQEARIKELKELKRKDLVNKFEIFKLENPEFIQKVKQENPLFGNEEMLEKVAFSKWESEFSNL